ncbi:hypothetical protein HMI55_002615 [Coelomomyces lativittatus]|nr:hypothetical protein HMI55_002615 [Coelomomyces lativittatus]
MYDELAFLCLSKRDSKLYMHEDVPMSIDPSSTLSGPFTSISHLDSDHPQETTTPPLVSEPRSISHSLPIHHHVHHHHHLTMMMVHPVSSPPPSCHSDSPNGSPKLTYLTPWPTLGSGASDPNVSRNHGPFIFISKNKKKV